MFVTVYITPYIYLAHSEHEEGGPGPAPDKKRKKKKKDRRSTPEACEDRATDEATGSRALTNGCGEGGVQDNL